MGLAKHIAALAAFGCIQGCTAVKTAVHNFADLDDHRIFANRPVETGPRLSSLRTLAHVPAFVARIEVADEDGRRQRLEDYLDATRTAAFVVLRDDRIVYERYGRGYGESSLFNSFSIAKAIMATLVGIAVDEGHIGSLDATVAEHRADLAATAYGPVALKHLLAMTSGVGDAPSMLPGRAQYYYGDNLLALVKEGKAEAKPGDRWRYSEADIQVLGFVLEAAVGTTLSAYIAEKLWKPLGMESDALWALDREGGAEKAFCCLSARARDFARFGRVLLDGGRLGSEQVVPVTSADPSAFPGTRMPDGYTQRRLWWFPEGAGGDYYAYGHNGQYLYVNPSARTVIVKLSENDRSDPLGAFRAIADTLRPEARVAELDRLAASALASR